MLNTLSAPRLYAITDSTLMSDATFEHQAKQALRAGVQWIQYRDKSHNKSKRHAQATLLVQLCKYYSAKLIINDDVELAQSVGACGVHLGQGDGDIAHARTVLGNNAIIGSTCHDKIELAIKAKEQGASYIAFGRFFASHTKPHAKPAPLSLIKQAKKVGLPIVVIGGITTHNANTLIQAGAECLAVCHDIFGVKNIQKNVSIFHSIAAKPI